MKRVRRQIVLGLRATPEQRAWLNVIAAERGLSLQALFEEILRERFEGSPWSPSGEVLVSIPVDAQASVTAISNVYRSGRKLLINLVENGCLVLRNLLKAEEENPDD